jgi:hypothetical protein
MRYAVDTYDLLDRNNASIHYCAKLNIFQVLSNRIIEEYETVGMSFGEEYWYSEEWDIYTCQKARVRNGGQNDIAWASLIRKKVKQQRAILEDVTVSESEGYDSESDAEPEDKYPSDIPQ